MVDGIRIDALDTTVTETRDHVVATMNDGLTVQLSVAQILGLIELGDVSAFLTGANVDTTGNVTLNDALALRLKRDGSNFLDAAETAAFRLAAGLGYADLAAQVAFQKNIGISQAGQCQLVLDGANIRLNRFNGKFVAINGQPEEIPTAGVALAPTGLTVGTLHYVYAYMAAGVMTLVAETTAPTSFTSTYGLRTKTGDATRTLVGMAQPITGPAFVQSSTQWYVRSWFNRDKPNMAGASATYGTAATSFTVLSSNWDLNLLMWEGERFFSFLQGTCYLSSLNATNGYLGVSANGATMAMGDYAMVQSNGHGPLFAGTIFTAAADGLQYTRCYGAVDSSSYTVTAYRAMPRGFLL